LALFITYLGNKANHSFEYNIWNGETPGDSFQKQSEFFQHEETKSLFIAIAAELIVIDEVISKRNSRLHIIPGKKKNRSMPTKF